jgi:hypothetical protein
MTEPEPEPEFVSDAEFIAQLTEAGDIDALHFLSHMAPESCEWCAEHDAELGAAIRHRQAEEWEQAHRDNCDGESCVLCETDPNHRFELFDWTPGYGLPAAGGPDSHREITRPAYRRASGQHIGAGG